VGRVIALVGARAYVLETQRGRVQKAVQPLQTPLPLTSIRPCATSTTGTISIAKGTRVERIVALAMSSRLGASLGGVGGSVGVGLGVSLGVDWSRWESGEESCWKLKCTCPISRLQIMQSHPPAAHLSRRVLKVPVPSYTSVTNPIRRPEVWS
jgi:hypothetical protein